MTDRNELSGPRAKILHFPGEYSAEHGRSPTYREIEEALNMALAVVSYHIGVLEEWNYVRRRPHVARGLQLTDQGKRYLGIRGRELGQIGILGTIVAGHPIAVSPSDRADPEDATAWIAVDPGRLPRQQNNLFALEVCGQSMIDALVDDRDIVILQRTIEPREIRNGDMVAAWLTLQQETTLKYFFGNHTKDSEGGIQ